MTSPQSIGGNARAKALSAAERRTIARKAAAARWGSEAGSKPVSPAKLRRLIEANIASVKGRATELRRLSAIALDAVKDADALVAVLEQAAGMLEGKQEKG